MAISCYKRNEALHGSDLIVPDENRGSKIPRGPFLHVMAAMLALALLPVKHNQYPLRQNVMYGRVYASAARSKERPSEQIGRNEVYADPGTKPRVNSRS